ncbi:hypothetical protein ACFXK0_20030 [Nocardia sp. NPDC059177]|uniref:hypothetical protein n=1 Tax=Nocardia sp. NPDC059177 TaxID=3346759 RepID=UPI00367AB3C2
MTAQPGPRLGSGIAPSSAVRVARTLCYLADQTYAEGGAIETYARRLAPVVAALTDLPAEVNHA